MSKDQGNVYFSIHEPYKSIIIHYLCAFFVRIPESNADVMGFEANKEYE